ncbi:MAG TPA: chloride channel protein [Longimicrobiales bacterium]|nr:chloride channel protein [Longimicrobiales bacterium]
MTTRTPVAEPVLSKRVVLIAGLTTLIGAAAGVVAVILSSLIGLITNLAFYGRIDTRLVSPAHGKEGLWLLIIPSIGGLIVGLMARFGSSAIRGHGIPEVMENILLSGSRIPKRILFLKPLSAAIAIGTGGPFGAEGPIIATGGALGSTVGQSIRVTPDERKVLLAAGAAAGMAATFGTPVAAVLLAIELLLFEYRARSVIPVALAASAATAVRIAFFGNGPAFHVPLLTQPSGAALATYTLLGAVIGVLAVLLSRAIYWIEDRFEHLPIHWMWWPPIGAVAVGIIGLIEPRTLGIGYEYIEQIAAGQIVGIALVTFITLKFLSWSIYLGSGTSGGTLAPMFMIGGGAGAAIAQIVNRIAPALGLNVTIAALVGMAGIFAGASHALLASVVFAFETTRQPIGLLPLLAGCSASYLVSLLLAPTSIMTERLARRGRTVRTEYQMDYLSQVLVADVGIKDVVTLDADRTLGDVRAWLRTRSRESTHQGFPVVTSQEKLIGVVTRRDLDDESHRDEKTIAEIIKRPLAVVFDYNTLRDAADHMVREHVGRLPVVTLEEPDKIVGIISRSDLLTAHHHRLRAAGELEPGLFARFGNTEAATGRV